MTAQRFRLILLAYLYAVLTASFAVAILHAVIIMLGELNLHLSTLLFVLPATIGFTPFVLLFTFIPGLLVAISAELAGLDSPLAYMLIGVGAALLCMGVVGWYVMNFLIYPASGAAAGYVYWLVAGRNSVPYGD